jgi:thiamine kinase-like enzyme
MHVIGRRRASFHIIHHQSDRTRGHSTPSSLPFTSLTSFSTRTMSQTHPNASSSTSSNFQSVLNAALDAYERKTKGKLLTHSLAAQLQSCDSPTTILSVLQDLIQQFDHHRRSDERLSNWLNPTVNVLYAFSSTLGQGVGLVSLNRTSCWNL